MRAPIAGLILSLALVTAARGAASRNALLPDAAVTLPAGSSLEELLQLLDGQVGGVQVADAGTARRTLPFTLKDAAYPEALDRISREFDCSWIRRGNSLVLQSRLRDAEDDPFLELGELKLASRDWATLVRPFAPRIGGLELIPLKTRFLASLTPQQQQAAMGGGLPFAAMSREQRQAILLVNADHNWTDADRELERARLCFEGWERLSLNNSHPGEPVREFSVSLAAVGGDGIGITAVNPQNRRPGPPRAEGSVIDPLSGKPPAGLEQVWRIPVQSLTLAALAKDLTRQGGPVLEIPEYASSRKLYVSSSTGRRWDILRAVCDLWGWELSGKEGKYHLGRPHPSPATNVSDLYAKMRQSVPPVIRYQARALSEESITERLGRDVEVVLNEVTQREGLGWKTFRIGELSPRAQKCLANVVAWRQYQTWLSNHERDEQPRPYVQNPESCFFQLTGELGPGKHPGATIAGIDPNGKRLWWAWVVDSSKFVPSPRKMD